MKIEIVPVVPDGFRVSGTTTNFTFWIYLDSDGVFKWNLIYYYTFETEEAARAAAMAMALAS